ncbi:uncharacterized protein LOC113492179 [Trichoplusia ni]|uniref:Uncharacterized protein LOC113492179 n=1 Tax=Trichoplusia ni TaxID=7111 RepID=A0A7E5VAM9_TRINI|nr:uncharacterized protein LOC113492179 [Trichoplusia ni]
MELLCLIVLLQVYFAASEIRSSLIVNKLSRVRPVGAHVGKSFVPLTEIPPPHIPHIHVSPSPSRRHLSDDCTKKPPPREVHEGPRVEIFGDYYDDKIMKTVATVIFPDHIDHKHFQVTTQVPYLTLGPIEAIGYHPSTIKSEHPSECEKIYQDHLDDQYSEESKDYSEESLEMARMPLFPAEVPPSIEEHLDKMYDDMDK